MNFPKKNSLRASKGQRQDEVEVNEVEFVYKTKGRKQEKIVLGTGSFATVYLVRHKRTGQLFALKMVVSRD
jgi:hypothetical protein